MIVASTTNNDNNNKYGSIEPPTKRLCQGLRSKTTPNCELSATEDDTYCADDERALEEINDWQNIFSRTSEWDSSDMDSSDDSDWDN